LARGPRRVPRDKTFFGSPHLPFCHFLPYPSWPPPKAGLGQFEDRQVARLTIFKPDEGRNHAKNAKIVKIVKLLH
jgi:hypothetical protein